MTLPKDTWSKLCDQNRQWSLMIVQLWCLLELSCRMTGNGGKSRGNRRFVFRCATMRFLNLSNLHAFFALLYGCFRKNNVLGLSALSRQWRWRNASLKNRNRRRFLKWNCWINVYDGFRFSTELIVCSKFEYLWYWWFSYRILILKF